MKNNDINAQKKICSAMTSILIFYIIVFMGYFILECQRWVSISVKNYIK